MAEEEVKGKLFSFDELVSIFSYLSPENLSKCSRVCRDWHEASQVGSLWKRHCLQRWNFCHLGKLKPGKLTEITSQFLPRAFQSLHCISEFLAWLFRGAGINVAYNRLTLLWGYGNHLGWVHACPSGLSLIILLQRIERLI